MILKLAAAVFIALGVVAALFVVVKYDSTVGREAAIDDCKAAGQELATQEPCTEYRYHHTRQR